MNAKYFPNSDQNARFANLVGSVIETSPLAMAVLEGPEFFLNHANNSFLKFLSLNLEQLENTPLRDLIPAEDGSLKVIERVYATETAEIHDGEDSSRHDSMFWSYAVWPVQFEGELRGVMIQVAESAKLHEQVRAANEALTVEAMRQLERTDAAEGLNVLLRKEIAERLASEEALRAAQSQLLERTAELNATNKQLETFMYSVAHDLRSPLRSIKIFSELLVSLCTDKITQHEKSYLDRIVSNAEKMDRLIQDLLVYSRTVKAELTLKAVSLHRLIEQMLDSEPMFQLPEAEITIEGTLPEVIANETLLNQCLANLLGNAVKFVPRERKPVVRVWSENMGREARIWFEDNGIGIEERHLANIFKIFERLHDTKEYPGTGIGLSIVKSAVERMGGQIGVESTPGAGSRFWVQLSRVQ